MTESTSPHIESSGPAYDWNKLFILLAGLGVFLAVYFMPAWPDAIDPAGKSFTLSPQGKAAIGLFLMAGIWWIWEVIPIGVTAIAIGVFQALFLIRPAKDAFRDFMDPSVMFIFGSIVIGLAFTKSGLTRRLAYKMLTVAGENSNMILLGCLVVTAALAHLMAHTAVAATMFPILLAIYALYGEGDKQTNFGKALFIGMAYAAGAGSIITFLGSARAPAAAGMYKEFTGNEIGFFELSTYMAVIGWLMVFAIWLYLIVFLKPEKKSIPGLKDTVQRLSAGLGPLTTREKTVLLIVFGIVLLMALKGVVPGLKPIDRAPIMLVSTLLFFIVGILSVKDLEEIPWNIILLFSGAMSIGFCLWQTGAAEWMAVQWLALLQDAHWFVFVMGIAAFVLVLTNFIMNVAAIAIVLPVALVIAKYLGVSPDVVMYASLVTAGMPFVLLIGAAPNAIAYDSRQFTPGEFFRHGLLLSVVLLGVLALAITLMWPLLGMPILVGQS
ncbi:MAG: solute carrier family 13 (sodium-dependent dicarboxylate transporter) member 2/3/5 [bacterium]|nr:MAG: solute carrier family 13 (sodium-dependent dicarboxylate transporter) member 2/3/5 [bacterium]KAF0146958.1 MAG: solute carrier family 13 (sodium-dependent dicarboxylate transporter) member 2/3/5 [bacterium]KAF0163875.1 MAG: solute carrier family 13 (sodium-dependent dicarboxylate transporter) member 2/3/5 [bacterium]TXT16152.1 MAG: solute carrier family 13 (sodium-dependent dicarboxylate transporter) member 2/3/5 [bacterium]